MISSVSAIYSALGGANFLMALMATSLLGLISIPFAMRVGIPSRGHPRFRVIPFLVVLFLIRAFSEVRKKHVAKLVFLGEGPLKEELEDLAKTLGVGDSLSFPGFVSNPWSYMSRSHAFVLSSRWEGFGRVIVEAMASGTPVISTDCDYWPGEINTSGRSGLLVPVDDVERLAEAIEKVLDDEELASSLKSEGLRRASDFDARKICTEYEDLMSDVAG